MSSSRNQADEDPRSEAPAITRGGWLAVLCRDRWSILLAGLLGLLLAAAILLAIPPTFAGRLLDQWALLNKIQLDFSRPRKPTDNAFIEAFNSPPRQECLNASWFLSMADARSRIEAWRIDYNQHRPQTSLGGLTREAFAAQITEP